MTLSPRHILTPLCVLILLGMAAGCNSDCTENQNAIPLAGFYAADSTASQLTLSGLRVYGIGAPGDSVLFEGTSSASQLYLPFRVDSDNTVYEFTLTKGSGDSSREISSRVSFNYTRTPKFVSRECGVSFVYGIRSIDCSGELIDSVTCPMGEITNVNIENLHIYFSPSAIAAE